MKSRLFALGIGLLLSTPALATDEFDLSDLVPATSEPAVAPQGKVTRDGDVIVADSAKQGVYVAHQELLEENGPGVKMIAVGSGIGILSTGIADYSVFQNRNATLLSKRRAYIEALQIAKKQLVENMKGIDSACATVAAVSVDAIDTATESVANTENSLKDGCKESVQGALAGYVTFDVNDDTEEKTVTVSLISTPKTRRQTQRRAGALTVTTDPNQIFKQVVADLRRGVTPPVGAKVLTNAETGETYIIGFGSAIIRDNKNKAVARKLKTMAISQSSAKARSALLAVMQGENVYWQGGFDESQEERNAQFEYAPDTMDPASATMLEDTRNQFVSHIKQSDAYRSATQGRLPAGVAPKSFPSADGNWMYTIAVYSPSLEAISSQAAAETRQRAQPQPTVRQTINSHGGIDEHGQNDRGASGQVSQTQDL